MEGYRILIACVNGQHPLLKHLLFIIIAAIAVAGGDGHE